MTLDRQLAGVALAKIEAEVGPLHLAASRDGLDGEVLVGPGYDVIGELPATPFTDASDLWAAPLNKLYIQHPELTSDELAAAAGRAPRAVSSPSSWRARASWNCCRWGCPRRPGCPSPPRLLGVKAAETIAFGDMPNDIPMFAWSGHGVAMANAHRDLRAVADEVTASNEDDGIAVVLEHLLG